MDRPVPVENLCEKCRQMPWDTPQESTSLSVPRLASHHQSFGDLQNSAKTGCRACQTFWLYIMAVSQAKVDDDFELEITWKISPTDAQIIIETSSQSFTLEERERTAQDISIERPQSTMSQISTPRPEVTTDEICTMNKKFVAHIDVEFEHYAYLRSGEVDSIPYDALDLEYIMEGFVKPWMDECVKTHQECREMQQLDFGDFAPTRLIDVGTMNQDTVQLVDTRELSKPRYLILSYCWGDSNDRAKTTQSNIEQRRESIQIAALSETIRDAISVTRHMGVQYLWVDAICIIQPDTEKSDGFLGDWKVEAPKMASYYSNALCCISVLSAINSSDGFLGGTTQAELWQWGQEQMRLYRYCGAERFQHGDRKFTMQLPGFIGTWNLEWLISPLMRRAWALQEWVLSPRILHCSRVGMFMDCNRGICHSNYPFPQPPTDYHHVRSHEISKILKESPSQAELGASWMKLVTFYSTMNLTNQTDRLVAVDGIGRLICAKYKTGYFAGVLGSHVAQTLLWRRDGAEDEVIKDVNFPSWSWSSIMNVNFPRFNSECASYVRCTDDSCFLLPDKVVDYTNPSARRFPLQGPVLPFDITSDFSPMPGTYSLVSYVHNGPIWKKKDVIVGMDSTERHEKFETCDTDREREELSRQRKLLVCLKSSANHLDGCGFPSDVSYHGLIIERLLDAGVNVYQRIEFFETGVNGTQEPDDDVERWRADIDLV